MSRLRILWAALKMKLPRPVQRALYAGRLRVVDGRVMDVEAQVVGELASLVRGGGTLPTVEESRAQLAALAHRLDTPCPDSIQRHDITLPGADGDRPARIYVARGADPYAAQPTLLYLHGGGWIQGGIDTHDGTCGKLAERAGIRVISYDYRLAPEHRFPAAPDDVLACYLGLLERGAALGIAPGALAVGGDSAGGNLTAGLMHDLAERGAPMPAAQLLIYPATDARMQTRSHDSLRAGFVLDRQRIDWYLDLYLPEGHDREDPRFSAGLSPHLAGQPQAMIIVAGHDPLRDDGIEHAAALDRAGVAVELVEFPGQIHAFISLARVIPQGDAALSRAARWLAGVLA